jgi:hypothetical protein
MLKSATSFLAFVIVILTIFLVSERTLSPSFSTCIAGGPSGFAAIVGAHVSCSGDLFERHGNGITALATLAIAAFTGTLWFATSQQVRLTKEALIADKRAFVYATGPFQLFELDVASGHHNWRFRPQWNNSGDTPTKNMAMYTECMVRNAPLPAGFDFDSHAHGIGHGMIPPKSFFYGGLAPTYPQAAITPQDILDAQAGRKFIYLWGWIKYYDVFPSTRQHVTRFCWLITPAGDPRTFVPNTQGQPPTPGAMGFPSVHHIEGNCADDECPS